MNLTKNPVGICQTIRLEFTQNPARIYLKFRPLFLQNLPKSEPEFTENPARIFPKSGRNLPQIRPYFTRNLVWISPKTRPEFTQIWPEFWQEVETIVPTLDGFFLVKVEGVVLPHPTLYKNKFRPHDKRQRNLCIFAIIGNKNLSNFGPEFTRNLAKISAILTGYHK